MQWLDEIGDRGKAILEDPETAFGAGVRVFRTRLGWSQKQLSAEIKAATSLWIDPSAITRIEAGRTVSLKQAVAIAYTLQVEALDMVLDPPPMLSDEEYLDQLRRDVKDQEQAMERIRTDLQVNEKVYAVRVALIDELERKTAADG